MSVLNDSLLVPFSLNACVAYTQFVANFSICYKEIQHKKQSKERELSLNDRKFTATIATELLILKIPFLTLGTKFKVLYPIFNIKLNSFYYLQI